MNWRSCPFSKVDAVLLDDYADIRICSVFCALSNDGGFEFFFGVGEELSSIDGLISRCRFGILIMISGVVCVEFT